MLEHVGTSQTPKVSTTRNLRDKNHASWPWFCGLILLWWFPDVCGICWNMLKLWFMNHFMIVCEVMFHQFQNKRWFFSLSAGLPFSCRPFSQVKKTRCHKHLSVPAGVGVLNARNVRVHEDKLWFRYASIWFMSWLCLALSMIDYDCPNFWDE